jgi:AcrR family transcriptional regulator
VDVSATIATVDGRRLRREHNREAVLDALVELFGEGEYQPSSNDIAHRAGISPRSLFRYFDDIDDLHRAAIERQLAAARPLLDIGADPDDPVATKIERLLAARVQLFETTAPAARSARVCSHRHPVIANQVRASRAFLRRQIARLFARELAGDRSMRLPAVDALCSFETYEMLRFDQGLSRSKAESALNTALTALLDPDLT